MKKWIVSLLTLALVLGLCAGVSAQETFRYELRDGGVWITGANVGGDLTVPAELDGVPVVGLADGAFYKNTAITSVTLPEGLRFIGGHVFTECTGIRGTLLIPDSVESIGPWSLWTLDFAGKDFSAADRYRQTFPNENFTSTGTIPGYTSVEEDGIVYWLHGGEAELVNIRAFLNAVITLPETVQGCPLTVIGPWCCACIDSLTGQSLAHIVVPGTVRRLRAHAFQDARMNSLYLSEGVQVLESCSLAVGYTDVTITVPASAREVAGPLFRSADYMMTPKVYAYSGTEAARLALAENCTLVRRDAADGRIYGCREGLDYYIEDGQVAIYDGRAVPPFQVNEIKEIPAEIDGFPVTEVALEVYSGMSLLLIPPTVTKLTFREGSLTGIDLVLYYPGTYAERFCSQYGRYGLRSESIYSFLAPDFADVVPDIWYYDAVCFVYGAGLMNGTGTQTFSPNAATSRAMLVTVLWRMAGEPEPENACPFDDVQPESWYAPAVRWAYETGVSNGISETAFAPDVPVTREQIAALLLRYARMQGMDGGGRAELGNYPDVRAVSDWALEPMQWARAAGIVKGTLRGGEVYLDPQANARRCEIAEMLMRFCLNTD